MSGKVLQAGQNILCTVGLDPCLRMFDDLSGIGRKTAFQSPDNRIVLIGVQINNRGKIQVDSEALQHAGSG